jgi:hypothetical protein
MRRSCISVWTATARAALHVEVIFSMMVRRSCLLRPYSGSTLNGARLRVSIQAFITTP